MVSGASITSPSFLAPAQLGFGRLAQETEDSAARLSGGQRILRNSDDSTSVSIIARLKSQVVELQQSSRNVAFSDTLVDVASQALTNIQTLLGEAADLADEANSASQPDVERAFSQQRLTEILQEIDDIAADTTFNNQPVLDGSFVDTDITVGLGEGNSIELDIPAADSDSLFSGSLPDVSTQANAATAETQIADALTIVNTAIGDLNGAKDRLLTAETNIRTTLTGVDDGRAALEDIEPDQELQAFTLSKIQVDVATAAIAQARKLSSDLLDVLNFPLPETTGQENEDEAQNTEADPTQTSAKINAVSSPEAA